MKLFLILSLISGSFSAFGATKGYVTYGSHAFLAKSYFYEQSACGANAEVVFEGHVKEIVADFQIAECNGERFLLFEDDLIFSLLKKDEMENSPYTDYRDRIAEYEEHKRRREDAIKRDTERAKKALEAMCVQGGAALGALAGHKAGGVAGGVAGGIAGAGAAAAACAPDKKDKDKKDRRNVRH